MLNNSSNMTSQSIFIDNFTQKQNFCYSLLYFKNIEGITNQGQILDYYFPEKNFLLLPRNIITKNIHIAHKKRQAYFNLPLCSLRFIR